MTWLMMPLSISSAGATLLVILLFIFIAVMGIAVIIGMVRNFMSYGSVGNFMDALWDDIMNTFFRGKGL